VLYSTPCGIKAEQTPAGVLPLYKKSEIRTGDGDEGENMKISAVLFDVDGTILDTERIYMQSWRLAAKEAGYDLPEEALIRTRAVDSKTAAEIFRSYCGEAFDYTAIWHRRIEITEELYYTLDPGKLFKPGALEFMEYLDRRGIRKAVATSTLANRSCPHLEYVGLLAPALCGKYPLPAKQDTSFVKTCFDVTITGDQVTRGKPDPEIFLKAAESLGVAPEECIVCEDSGAGVRAGAAAGAKVFMIPDCVPMKESDKEYLYACLKSMKEAPALLEELEK